MKKRFTIVLFLISLFSFVFAGTTGIRNLPLYYIPGTSINVLIYISPSNTYAIIIKEKLPAGWQILSSNPSYSKVEFDGTNYTYTWLIFNFDKEFLKPFEIVYTVNIPSGISGTYNFFGKILSLEEGEIIIGGNSYISDEIYKGDMNNDGKIDISDVILCLRMALELEKKDLEKGDMNNDGDIDITDVILILRIIINLT